MKKFFVFNILIYFLFGSDVDYSDNFAKGMINGIVRITNATADSIDNMNEASSNLNKIIADSNKRLSCDNKYWDYKRKSDKVYFELLGENNNIKQLLQKRHINYSIFLENVSFNYNIDYALIKKESCSRSYYDMRVNAEKNMFRVIQENKILRDIAKKNYIVLGNELVDNHSFDVVDTDIRNVDDIEHRNAMNDLKIQLLH
jgi:CHAT domain-containing protein